VEWTHGDRPLENVSQVINSFYRPQIAVPGGLMLKKGQYTKNLTAIKAASDQALRECITRLTK
ncbi:hypothetical protein, partial [Pseudomonas viridiflava]|uniref:hypothetical protein n=1 Tax=Pseudomonas viridiflava TaxID=33069 RepID=UPI0019D0F4F4